MITAIVFTKNEENRINLVLKNLKNFSDIIVFDGGSEDGTEEICKKYKVKFIRRPEYLVDFCGKEYEWAMSQVNTPYVLLVNCSHHYPSRLLKEFKSIASNGKYHAVYHDIIIYSYGQIVQRPFIRRRSSACNFFRVDAINFEKSVIHNEVPVDIDKNLIVHLEPSDSLSIHLFRDYDLNKTELNHGRYSIFEASQRFEHGKRSSFLKIIIRPLRVFIYQYIRCGSILRGSAGLIVSLLNSYLELSIQIRLWEIERGLNLKKIRDIHSEIREKMINSKF